MISRLLATIALALAGSSCVHVEYRTAGAPIEGDVYATVIRRYGPLPVVRELSDLHGVPGVQRLDRLFVEDADARTKVTIFGAQGARAMVSLATYAHRLAMIGEALEQATGVRSTLRRLDVNLIPSGVAFRSHSNSLRGRRLAFSLRTFDTEAETLSDSIRTIAHELFHVSVGVNWGVQPGLDNEKAAMAAESCVELLLTNRTAGAMPADIGRARKGRVAADDPISTSIAARYGPDDELEGHFKQGPIIGLQNPRAPALLSLCRKRAERLRAAGP